MTHAEIDYTTYNLTDLLDAAAHIDRKSFPERAATLDAEIVARRSRGEIAGTNTQADSSGCAQYAVAFGAFVPAVGFLAGIVAIGLAFIGPKARRGATLGIAVSGIAFNCLLYGSLFFFGLIHPTGPFRGARDQLTRQQLSELVRNIEFFRMQEGRYPKDLDELQTIVPNASIYDSSRFSVQLPKFFYRLSRDGPTYSLLSPGPDDRPFTADDLTPDLSAEQVGKTGLRNGPQG